MNRPLAALRAWAVRRRTTCAACRRPLTGTSVPIGGGRRLDEHCHADYTAGVAW